MLFRYALLAILLALAKANSDEYCEDLSCASREELLETIRHLQDERVLNNLHKKHTHINEIRNAMDDSSPNVNPISIAADTNNATCSICNSNPCLNGGICIADSTDPFHKFLCQCPDDFAGPTCAKNITCTKNSCGSHATCFVSNHQTNCVCDHGYSGNNPRNGCSSKIVKACAQGDPHIQTFDRLYYDYQGTCPYVFSQPCGNLTGGFDNFKVVAKNELITGATVAYVSEIEVTMFGNKIHVDRQRGKVYVNGFTTSLPFYSPSKSNPKINVFYSSGTYYVKNIIDQVQVTFTTYGELCIYVPDVPEMTGNETLCGIAGNYDGIYKNDIVGKDGTVWKLSGNPEKTSTGENRVLDTWISDDFLYLRPDENQCVTGEQLANNTYCDVQASASKCNPIKEAIVGIGPFGDCQGMGNDTIQQYYDNCLFDVCHGYPICSALTDFVRTCQVILPNTDLGDWRTNPESKCAYACPLHSHYSSCTSSCPATCAEQYKPDFCDLPCSEGCACDDGYVIDNTNIATVTCIPVQSCGCSDAYGNSHPANQPWISNNCNILNECVNGTFNSQIYQCSPYADCGVDSNGYLGCQCRQGFQGDGTYCEDINECLDGASCSQTSGNGNCTNTIGSYQCQCNTFYDGHDCQYYHPRRHCADLYKYWNYHSNGVYTINPPYNFGNQPAFADVKVYCDMTTANGGWTLMSHDSGSGMADKTFLQYRTGFGNASDQNVWIGLDLINGMTQEVETSLMLSLLRCAHNGQAEKTTTCTYADFSVDGFATNYTVTIPTVCSGTEQEYYDGWARWNLTNPGPQFQAFDHDNTQVLGGTTCSSTFRNTGFWYDTSFRCGEANLNGVRYSCDSPPDNSEGATYLYWSGAPLGDAWLSLRPKYYPDYDNHAITPVNKQDFAN